MHTIKSLLISRHTKSSLKHPDVSDHDRMLIVGRNPGLEQLVNMLTGEEHAYLKDTHLYL